MKTAAPRLFLCALFGFNMICSKARAQTVNIIDELLHFLEEKYNQTIVDFANEYRQGIKHYLILIPKLPLPPPLATESMVYMDLDDYLEVTEEGRSGWVTLHGHIAVSIGLQVSLFDLLGIPFLNVGYLELDNVNPSYADQAIGHDNLWYGFRIRAVVIALFDDRGHLRIEGNSWMPSFGPEFLQYTKHLGSIEVTKEFIHDWFIANINMMLPLIWYERMSKYVFDAFLHRTIPFRIATVGDESEIQRSENPDFRIQLFRFLEPMPISKGAKAGYSIQIINTGRSRGRFQIRVYLNGKLVKQSQAYELEPYPETKSHYTANWSLTEEDTREPGQHDFAVELYSVDAQRVTYTLNTVLIVAEQLSKPTARIRSITPNPASQGTDKISFVSEGFDSDQIGDIPAIRGYRWLSSVGTVDGRTQLYPDPEQSQQFGPQANFEIPSEVMLPGEHKIVLQVLDNDGQVSEEDVSYLLVHPRFNVLGYDLELTLRLMSSTLASGEITTGTVFIKNNGNYSASGKFDITIVSVDGLVLGETNYSISSVPVGQTRATDFLLKPKPYEGLALLRASLISENDSNPQNNVVEASIYYGELPKSTVFGPVDELNIGPPSYCGQVRSLKVCVLGLLGNIPEQIQVNINNVIDVYSVGAPPIDNDIYWIQYYAYTTSSSRTFVFKFWFDDKIYNLEPHIVSARAGTNLDFIWSKKDDRWINPDLFTTRFISREPLDNWITSEDNVGNKYRLTLRVPLGKPPMNIPFTAYLVKRRDTNYVEAITRGEINILNNEPPTTTILGGAIVTNSTRVCFSWVGSDDVTPSGELTYSYRLEPFDSSYSTFVPLNGVCYSNVPPGSYTFYVKARDSSDIVETTPATQRVIIRGVPPQTPINIFPDYDRVSAERPVELMANSFHGLEPYSKHSFSQFQVRLDAYSYSDTVWDSGVTNPVVKINVPSEVLSSDQKYWWRVRYLDNYGTWSSWSTETPFYTSPAYPTIYIKVPSDSQIIVKNSRVTLQWSAVNIQQPDWLFFLSDSDSSTELDVSGVTQSNSTWVAEWMVSSNITTGCRYVLRIVDNKTGTQSTSASFCVYPPSPEIIQPPNNLVVVVGQIARFYVVASGETLVYQWYKGDAPLVDDGRIQGAKTDTLTINDVRWEDTGFYKIQITDSEGRTVESPRARLTVEPGDITSVVDGNLHFGEVVVGTISNRTLTIENQGHMNMVVSNLTYPEGFTGDWPGGVIPPGGIQTITVTFAPREPREYGGNVEIEYGPSNTKISLPASGRGIPAPVRRIELAGDLAFGEVVVGVSSNRTFVIRNSGTAPLAVSNVSYPEGFSGPRWSGVLPVGGATNITVTFTPAAAKNYSGTVVIISDASEGANTLPISGKGILRPAGITVTKPAKGETLLTGNLTRLQWRTENISAPRWQFDLYRDDAPVGSIEPTQPRAVGESVWEADWRVPALLLEACDYTISVKDITSGAVGHSEAFCIRQPGIEIVEGPTTDVLYVADELPAEPQTSGEGTWNWVNREPVPVSGQWALQARGIRGLGQLWFRDAQRRMAIGPADRLVAQVYLDPARPPKMLMLQYRAGSSWEHRVFWGEDRFPYGTNGPTSEVRLGDLPPAGRWVRLEVPAHILGLDGRTLNGLGLVLFDGDATFDHVGKKVSAHDHRWVDDEIIPGATMDFAAGWGEWIWSDADPKPFFGTRSHLTPAAGGLRSQVLRYSTPGWEVGSDDSLVSHTYLDPANPPKMVMLQWRTDTWEHRAYWGEDRFPDGWTKGRPSSKRYMGPLPPAGQWVRLSVPADVVGLAGRTVTAMAFTTYDGRVGWDNSGKAVPAVDYFWVKDNFPTTEPEGFSNTGEPGGWGDGPPLPPFGNRVRISQSADGHQGHYFLNASPAMYVNPGDRLVAYVHLDPENPPRMVMLQWHDGNAWTHRAYWGENLFPYGKDGPPDRCYMGPLPQTGRWVRLEVPAHLVGLSGKTVSGMSFDRFGGQMAWGPAGKSSAVQTDETHWLVDSPPEGATLASHNEPLWSAVSDGPMPLLSAWNHYSPPSLLAADPLLQHQHGFRDAPVPLEVGAGDRLFAWVYLDPMNLPEMVMLQWNDGRTWGHRAFWGANRFLWGKDAPPERLDLGPLPPAGQWVRLEAPAEPLALNGQNLRGMTFTLHGGAAWWGPAGKIPNPTRRTHPANEWVWVEDELPAGTTPQVVGSDAWTWADEAPPGPLSGIRYHRSKWAPDRVVRTHHFANYTGGASQTMTLGAGDRLFCYVYLDPWALPQMIMLQWRSQNSWEHRAYWGEDLFAYGTGGPTSKVFMGMLPPAGRWVRLEVPARAVGLEGRTVNGMAFTLAGGMASWDRAGKLEPIPVTVGSLVRENQGFRAVLAGEPERTYRIEASENLVDWTPLVEVRADAEGRFEFRDPEAAGRAARFYRVVGD